MDKNMDGMMENCSAAELRGTVAGTVAIDDMERALLEFTKEAEEKRGIGVFDWNEMAKACVMEREDGFNEAERKFFEWVGEEDDKTFAKILNENILNRMRVERDMLRREADALDREIREIEQRELDLIKARNGRIVWERRLGLVEVEKGLEIGGVEIRNHREIEIVARMFGEIEENRK